jgi:hypothetical protein
MLRNRSSALQRTAAESGASRSRASAGARISKSAATWFAPALQYSLTPASPDEGRQDSNNAENHPTPPFPSEPKARKRQAWGETSPASENPRTRSPTPHVPSSPRPGGTREVIESPAQPPCPIAPFLRPSRALPETVIFRPHGSGGSRSPSLAPPPAFFFRSFSSDRSFRHPDTITIQPLTRHDASLALKCGGLSGRSRCLPAPSALPCADSFAFFRCS